MAVLLEGGMLSVGSLFSGIGGLERGLEATGGFRTAWQCEIDPYARAVLAKHWPSARRFHDVRRLRRPPRVDVLAGGFPCQDISSAGKRVGIDGEQSGLWKEFARLIRQVRPRYVVVENVAALLHRGLDRVLGDLASIGYDAEWDCVPASALGAPHRRDRVFVIAYPQGHLRRTSGDARPVAPYWSRALLAYANGVGISWAGDLAEAPRRDESSNGGPLANAEGQRRQGLVLDAPGNDAPGPLPAGRGWWAVEPAVGRMAHGVPDRVHRLTCLGNAVVPQEGQVLGLRILEIEGCLV